MNYLLIVLNIALACLLVCQCLKANSELKQNEQIASDFDKFLKTGDDYPWRGEK